MKKNIRRDKKGRLTPHGRDLSEKKLPGINFDGSLPKKEEQGQKSLDGSDLFSFFTANIIKEKVIFTR